MNKLAIFVEGQTEQLFIERLLFEIAEKNGLQVACYSARGGRISKRSITQIRVTGATEAEHFVMLVDCGNDGRVKSDIIERYEGLVTAGYSAIIGIRDVYPDVALNEIDKLRAGLHYRLRSKPIQVLFALGVMEIESWFLAEFTHFPKINPALTVQAIKASLGFDVETEDLQCRERPAIDLLNAYKLAGEIYDKSQMNVQRTIELLDYAEIYLKTKMRFPDLEKLINSIDNFLLRCEK